MCAAGGAVVFLCKVGLLIWVVIHGVVQGCSRYYKGPWLVLWCLVFGGGKVSTNLELLLLSIELLLRLQLVLCSQDHLSTEILHVWVCYDHMRWLRLYSIGQFETSRCAHSCLLLKLLRIAALHHSCALHDLLLILTPTSYSQFWSSRRLSEKEKRRVGLLPASWGSSFFFSKVKLFNNALTFRSLGLRGWRLDLKWRVQTEALQSDRAGLWCGVESVLLNADSRLWRMMAETIFKGTVHFWISSN